MIGLWCFYTQKAENQHLVIVADCCYSGHWGKTLENIVIKGRSNAELKKYCKILHNNPISIQSSTDELEVSYSGLFTPLWYHINTVTPEQIDASGSTTISDTMDEDSLSPQTPSYVSTSMKKPSWKVFDEAFTFNRLYNKACKQEDRGDPSSPAFPYYIACEACCNHLYDSLEKEERKIKQLQNEEHGSILQKALNNRRLLENELDYLLRTDYYVAGMPRAPALLPESENETSFLNRMKRKQVMERVPAASSEEKKGKVAPGLYVFPGGKGDMSLIVTPDELEVILIDGSVTYETFFDAWNSVLKYLTRITRIYVTHHDHDHTFGIELLLARYYLEKKEKQGRKMQEKVEKKVKASQPHKEDGSPEVPREPARHQSTEQQPQQD